MPKTIDDSTIELWKDWFKSMKGHCIKCDLCRGRLDKILEKLT